MITQGLPNWLNWAREIQSIAQIGNSFAENEFQVERYQRLNEIAAEIVTSHTDLPFEPIMKNFLIQPGYATPKIDVRGAVFRDSKLLMVQEKIDGGWTIPGGWVDVGDYPAASAEREVLEESGFRVKVQKLIGVYDANRTEPMEFYHAFKLVFLCDLLGGDATTSNETTDVVFFSEDQFPLSYSGQRTQSKHIRDAFKAKSDSSFQTVFE